MGVPVGDFRSHLHDHHDLESIAEMVVMAVSATMSNVVGVIGTDSGLSRKTASKERMMVRLPDQSLSTDYQPFPTSVFLFASKANAPVIPEACLYLLSLVSLSDACLHGEAFPLYKTLDRSKSHPRVQPNSVDPTTLPETEPARAGLRTLRPSCTEACVPCSPLLPQSSPP